MLQGKTEELEKRNYHQIRSIGEKESDPTSLFLFG
jgi:hypothetical protein